MVRVGPEQTTSGSKLGVSSKEWYEGLEDRAYLQSTKRVGLSLGHRAKEREKMLWFAELRK